MSSDLAGRTFVITGASSGLGLATTTALAARGARVVMAVRDVEKAAKVQPTGGETEVRRLELSDLDSVRAFAEGMRAEHDRIDVLINNAGVMAIPQQVSPQGHELQFATNHLGHFALTALLFDLLQAGRDPRIVTVTSINHRNAQLPFGDRRYSPMGAYSTSKLANALFGHELHRRLTAVQSPVLSVLAHPGYAVTGLQGGGTTALWQLLLGRIGNRLVAQPAATGALPQLFAATDPSVRSGDLIGPGGPGELRGRPAHRKLAPAATDPGNGRRLWDLSVNATGVSFPQQLN